MTNIDFLLEKFDGMKLSADEFKTLVTAVKENQDIAVLVPDKFGWVLKTATAGRNTLHFFKDKETAESWEINPTEENQPLTSILLPSSGGEAYSYVVKLETNSSTEIESSNRNISVNIRFISQVFNNIDQSVSDTGEDALVRIQRQRGGSDTWETVGLLNNFSSVPSNTGAYTTIDLSNYLVNGVQTIRFLATGNVSQLSTTYLSFNISVAEMNVGFSTNWGQAFIYNEDVISTHQMMIPLRITGNVYKILYWELFNNAGSKVNEGSIELGTTEYTETSYQGLLINHPQTVGIYNVKVRLRYGNTSVYTEWKELNIIVSVKNDTTTLLCVNNITANVYNWSSQHMLDYAVYNPTTLTTSVVSFELLDNTETISWMTDSNGNVQNTEIYDYTPYLGIENSSPSGRIRLFAAKLRVSVDGILYTTITYNVDNSNDFAPTQGANFVMMPSGRSNTDDDREVIHNESSVQGEPATVTATWQNVVFENDGWVTENDVKMLRLFSGSKVTIDYESYSNTSQQNGLTIEVDLKTKNISNEDAPIFKMGKEIEGQFVGMILYPKRGYFFKNVNNDSVVQDIEWGENVRTHIAVNIIPNLTIGGRSINLVRIFINGTINREFLYSLTDRFWDGVSSDGIQIGSTGADVDIFGIRIFKERALSSTDVFNDCVASIGDVQTKLDMINANNIMEGGVIKYALAKEKYNTLVWKGIYPSKHNQVTTNGDLVVNILGDPAHSGELINMKLKGQGTSSMRYLKWNGSWSFNDSGVWIDGNGTRKGKYYTLTTTSPKAKKLVGKINWASSMQSHKMGMCDMFNVLHENIFNGAAGYEKSGIKTLEGYENTKVAVEEKAFLFFVQEDPNVEPVYYGNMTWGSAKGDKLTFGYDASNPLLKDYLMLEGSDQTPVLTLCQVPWFEDEVVEHYDDGEIDGWAYPDSSTLCFDCTLGNPESLHHFISAFNLCFKYSTRINYYNGRLEDLQSDGDADKSYQYFIVGQTYDNFYVYRYDWINGLWVNAGITKTNGVPDPVYLPDQLGITMDPSSADFDGMLATVKTNRCTKFREVVGNYFHVNDMLFCMQFNKLNALSDNRAKNTYLYYDPVGGLIRNASDDNDTCLQTNNQGQKEKPYWVEEHDFDSRPLFNRYYWAASGNAMYNLFEDAYPSELRNMMAKILTTMNNLGVGYGDGGVLGFYERYLFYIQKYFPSVAYNECARLWYEYAQTIYGIPEEQGGYTNDTPPITQSLGDQLQSEKDWMKQRIFYIASYCMYDAALGGSIEYRQLATSTYNLVPAKKMYVYLELGTSKRFPIGYSSPKRCEAGETVTIVCEGSDTIQTYIVAAEYLADLGDMSRVSVTGGTAFGTGKRLVRLKAGDVVASSVMFKPNSIATFPPNAAVLDLRNIDTLTSLGEVNNLKDLYKLEEFYCTGTGLTSVELPQTNNLNTVVLNEEIQTLVLRNQKNIYTFNYTPTRLKSLTSGNCNVINQSFIENWLNSISEVSATYELEIDGINWTNFSATNLMKLINFGKLVLKGRIVLDGNSISSENWARVYAKLGSLIDSGELVIVYTNILTLSLSRTSIIGGEVTSICQFTLSSLEDEVLSLEYSTDGTTWIPMSQHPRITMTITTQRGGYLQGTLTAAEEVAAASSYRIRGTNGTLHSNSYYFSIIPKNRFTAVNVNGSKYLSQPNTSYQFTATLSPAGASEIPTYNWSIEGIDTSKYEIVIEEQEGIIINSRILRLSDSAVMIDLPNSNSAMVELSTGNQLMSEKNNNTSFIIRCTVRGTYGSEVTNTYSVVGHEQYVPRAVQSYDPEGMNYNPALITYLKNNEATTGAILHEELFEDGSRGFYLTITEAAEISDLGNMAGLTQIHDSIGCCVESYVDGVLNPNKYYLFKSFDEFQYFTNITTAPNLQYCTNLETLTIHSRVYRFEGYLPGSIRTLTFNEGFTSIGNWGEYLRDIRRVVYLPSTINDQTILFRGKPSDVYFNGTLEEWMRKNVLPTYEVNGYNAIGALDSPFNLYCNNELVTEIDASLIEADTSIRTNIQRCKSLTRINGTLTSLSQLQFNNCTSLTSIPVSDSITSIPQYCFQGCTKLNQSLPPNITSIGPRAFRKCNSLNPVALPSGLQSIGEGAFMECANLELTSLPAGVTSIGSFAFSSCSKLALTNLPAGVTSIGNNAFDGCARITITEIPDSVTWLGGTAFQGCLGLTTIDMHDCEVTVINGSEFSGCSNLTTISLPYNCTTIQMNAFYDCSRLQTVTFPEVLTYIGESAFYRCWSLQLTTLPDSVRTIWYNAFNGCGNVRLSALPSSIVTIQDSALTGTNCTFSIIPDSVTTLGSQNSIGGITSLSFSNTLRNPGGFRSCPNLESVYFRKNESDPEYIITSLPSFDDCPKLKKIGYGDSNTFVDGSVFIPTPASGLTTINSNSYFIRTSQSTINSLVSQSTLLTNISASGNLAYSWYPVSWMHIPYVRYINLTNLQDCFNSTMRIYCERLEQFIRTVSTRSGYINHAFINQTTPFLFNFETSSSIKIKKLFVPIGLFTTFMGVTGLLTEKLRTIEYNYTLDRAGVKTAQTWQDVISSNIPLYTPRISVNVNEDTGVATASISCPDDETSSSPYFIKVRYRINGGSWSDKIALPSTSSTITFTIETDDYIEVYAIHDAPTPLRGPSNMLKVTWDGTDIIYDYNNIYIDPVNDIDENGVYIDHS